MDFDGYDVQILVAVGRACKPNSPKRERAWTRVQPLSGAPEFGDTLSKLIRQGLLQRKHGYRVKPSAAGYEVIAQYKMHRLELKRRPLLFAQIIWEPRMIDFRMAA